MALVAERETEARLVARQRERLDANDYTGRKQQERNQ